jgi:TPR repeat protein
MEFHQLDWNLEPNLAELRRLYDMMEVDRAAAIRGLISLADKGSVGSMMYLADTCSTTDTSDPLASPIYWYKKAAQAGFPPAAYMVGRILQEEGDLPAARVALQQAAGLRYAPAAYRLAHILLDEGEFGSVARARSYLVVARRGGHVPAGRDLGVLIWKHPTTPWDRLVALKLFLQTYLEIPRIILAHLRGNEAWKERYRI